MAYNKEKYVRIIFRSRGFQIHTDVLDIVWTLPRMNVNNFAVGTKIREEERPKPYKIA